VGAKHNPPLLLSPGQSKSLLELGHSGAALAPQMGAGPQAWHERSIQCRTAETRSVRSDPAEEGKGGNRD